MCSRSRRRKKSIDQVWNRLTRLMKICSEHAGSQQRKGRSHNAVLQQHSLARLLIYPALSRKLSSLAFSLLYLSCDVNLCSFDRLWQDICSHERATCSATHTWHLYLITQVHFFKKLFKWIKGYCFSYWSASWKNRSSSCDVGLLVQKTLVSLLIQCFRVLYTLHYPKCEVVIW